MFTIRSPAGRLGCVIFAARQRVTGPPSQDLKVDRAARLGQGTNTGNLERRQQ